MIKCKANSLLLKIIKNSRIRNSLRLGKNLQKKNKNKIPIKYSKRENKKRQYLSKTSSIVSKRLRMGESHFSTESILCKEPGLGTDVSPSIRVTVGLTVS